MVGTRAACATGIKATNSIEDVLARGWACAFVRYTEIEGDPLWNPDRHTFVKPLRWTPDGMPAFGRPSRRD